MKRYLAIAFGLGLMMLADRAPGQGVGPYSYYGVAPCRIVDTRNPNGPTGGPALAGGGTRDFPIVNYCNVPSTAKAVTLNVTLVTPTVTGFVAVYQFGGSNNMTSNINATAGTTAIANAVVTLITSGTNNVTAIYGTAGGGTAHLLIDVTGYFQ